MSSQTYEVQATEFKISNSKIGLAFEFTPTHSHTPKLKNVEYLFPRYSGNKAKTRKNCKNVE